MLNYIWAGLIVSSFLFALGYDVRDITADRYRNDEPLPVQLDGELGRIEAARGMGLVPPAFLLDKAMSQITVSITSAKQGGSLVESIERRTKSIPGDWAGRARSIATQEIAPALQRERALCGCGNEMLRIEPCDDIVIERQPRHIREWRRCEPLEARGREQPPCEQRLGERRRQRMAAGAEQKRQGVGQLEAGAIGRERAVVPGLRERIP